MVMANAYEKYKTQEVATASPVGLIVMLYNGCIKRLKLARIAIENKDYEDANKNLKKAEDIIDELMAALDLKYQIARDLLSLYVFIYEEIVRINISKDAEKIEPLLKMLSSLRDTWAKVEKECRLPVYELSEMEQ
ncbi:MAG: flagellar export chaperone FliS [Burkholderiales bacterium]